MESPSVYPVAAFPAGHRDALRLLAEGGRDFLQTERYKALQHHAKRHGAHPDILAFEGAFVRKFRKLDVPMFAHTVVRTHDFHAAKYVMGQANAAPRDCPHVAGCAADLIHAQRAWDVPRDCWELMGHIGKELAHALGIEVVWGGDRQLAFRDPAHWELADWRAVCRDPAA